VRRIQLRISERLSPGAGGVANATVRTDNRGTRIYKEHKHSTRRIDLAVAAVMAHATATLIEPGPQLFVFE
jgi:phage terminase large subunit-like protein